jgi:hypothetical protein
MVKLECLCPWQVVFLILDNWAYYEENAVLFNLVLIRIK